MILKYQKYEKKKILIFIKWKILCEKENIIILYKLLENFRKIRIKVSDRKLYMYKKLDLLFIICSYN